MDIRGRKKWYKYTHNWHINVSCSYHGHTTENGMYVFRSDIPDSKVHGANMGPTWFLSAPDGPYVGPMNLAIRVGWPFNSSYLILHKMILLPPSQTSCGVWAGLLPGESQPMQGHHGCCQMEAALNSDGQTIDHSSEFRNIIIKTTRECLLWSGIRYNESYYIALGWYCIGLIYS